MTRRTRRYLKAKKWAKTHALVPFKSIDQQTGQEIGYFMIDDKGCIYGESIKKIA